MDSNNRSTVPWMSDKEWLEARRKVLTATDAAAIMGVHPWKSALQVYVEKTQGGELSRSNRRMRLGQRLEDDIAEEYAEETGRRVSSPAARLTIHPSIPWMAASLDRLVEDPERGMGVLELKAIWHRVGDDEELPAHWLVQVAQQMEVAQLPWASVASLAFGERLEWRDLAADPRFRDLLVDRLADFWARLQRGQPPAPDASESTTRALRALYPRAIDLALELPVDSDVWARQYVEASAEIGRLSKLKTEAQNQLMASMGEASEAQTPSGVRFTYRVEHRKGTTVAPKAVRVFRVSRAGRTGAHHAPAPTVAASEPTAAAL